MKLFAFAYLSLLNKKKKLNRDLQPTTSYLNLCHDKKG